MKFVLTMSITVPKHREWIYRKTCLRQPHSDKTKVLKTDYGLMQVKSIVECSKGEHYAILLTYIKR